MACVLQTVFVLCGLCSIFDNAIWLLWNNTVYPSTEIPEPRHSASVKDKKHYHETHKWIQIWLANFDIDDNWAGITEKK